MFFQVVFEKHLKINNAKCWSRSCSLQVCTPLTDRPPWKRSWKCWVWTSDPVASATVNTWHVNSSTIKNWSPSLWFSLMSITEVNCVLNQWNNEMLSFVWDPFRTSFVSSVMNEMQKKTRQIEIWEESCVLYWPDVELNCTFVKESQNNVSIQCIAITHFKILPKLHKFLLFPYAKLW